MCAEDGSVSDTDRGLSVIFTSVGSDSSTYNVLKRSPYIARV